MKIRCNLSFIIYFIGVELISEVYTDKPCNARAIKDQSVVCVCNETYCDEITREVPAVGEYVMYTSSEAGSRFRKSKGKLVPATIGFTCAATIELDINEKYQVIEGFGGAVTDAAGINWKKLSPTLQNHLINSYFSESGLQYNMLRTPIGGSDFSTRPYAYNSLPENDTTLSNYSLALEDHQYKIPMIKAILEVAHSPVHIIATTWSPPLWMKTKDCYFGISRLKHEYYFTYALYHYKFIDLYSNQGIPIWGITTTNEPLNGVIPLAEFNSLGWTPLHMGKWIVEHLGPMIRMSKYKDLKIITVDDQRYSIPYWFSLMVTENPKVLDYIDGIGVHYYGDIITPPTVFSLVTKSHPDKFIIGTEACEGSFPWQDAVVLGSWTRARNYIYDIITDLTYNLVGWLDWNLCLDELGGPNWAKNNVDSPIIVFPEQKEFVKQPMFYAMGHFSKFIDRGSRRINIVENMFTYKMKHIAFLTPRNTTVYVFYNNRNTERHVRIKVGQFEAKIIAEAKAVVTVEMKPAEI